MRGTNLTFKFISPHRVKHGTKWVPSYMYSSVLFRTYKSILSLHWI